MDIRERINQIIDADPDMTVRSVSLKAGLSDSMLHKFLRGDTKSPTLDTVDKLAGALGVDARWLAYGEGSAERAADVSKIFDRIAQQDQERALRILEAFTTEEKARA
jgi:transcriptional regulator with XRE-family HTH domain